MSTSNYPSENHSAADHSSNYIKMLEEELALVRHELLQKETKIDALQAAHTDNVSTLELERDQIIQSLMESEERYRSHILATTAVIWHGNAEGHFNVPQESWHDYTGQAWPLHSGAKWMQMIKVKDRGVSFAQEWKSQIEASQTFEIECQIWSESHQEHRHCQMNAIPMFSNASTQEIHAWVGSMIDIHERKLAEEHILSTNELLTKTVAELQLSNTELERFVYLASHDLKEPLRGMQNLATMIMDLYTEQLDADGQELLMMMYESGNRMEQLINDLHNYSRVKLTSDGLEQVSIDMLLDQILVGLRALPTQREYRIQRSSVLPNLYCNPVHLQTIFQNLISNALKYGDIEPAIIEIGVLPLNDEDMATNSAEEHIGKHIFYVRDNGIGLIAEHHELIFEMFKRIHVEDAYGGGTGAGLALVKKILEQYGGRIWVESTLGAGSTFYFTFGHQNKSEIANKNKNRFVDEKTGSRWTPRL